MWWVIISGFLGGLVMSVLDQISPVQIWSYEMWIRVVCVSILINLLVYIARDL